MILTIWDNHYVNLGLFLTSAWLIFSLLNRRSWLFCDLTLTLFVKIYYVWHHRDLNPWPSIYKAGVLTTTPWIALCIMNVFWRCSENDGEITLCGKQKSHANTSRERSKVRNSQHMRLWDDFILLFIHVVIFLMTLPDFALTKDISNSS